MSVEVDPNNGRSYVISLAAPEGVKPYKFWCKPVKMVDELRIGRVYEQITADDADAQLLFDCLTDSLNPLVTKWENIGIPYEENAIGKAVNTTEALELAGFILSAGRLTSEEKKRSE